METSTLPSKKTTSRTTTGIASKAYESRYKSNRRSRRQYTTRIRWQPRGSLRARIESVSGWAQLCPSETVSIHGASCKVLLSPARCGFIGGCRREVQRMNAFAPITIKPGANKVVRVEEGWDFTSFAAGLRFRKLMRGSGIDGDTKSPRAAHPTIPIGKNCLTRG